METYINESFPLNSTKNWYLFADINCFVFFQPFQGKHTANDENKALKSSKTFFTQLQDNISSTVKSKSMGKKKSATDFSKEESSAKRFKL